MPKETAEKDTSLKALQEAIKDIEKSYGKGSIMRLGEREHVDVPILQEA